MTFDQQAQPSELRYEPCETEALQRAFAAAAIAPSGGSDTELWQPRKRPRSGGNEQ